MLNQLSKFLYIVVETKSKLFLLFLLAALTSILEAFGVGLIGPFIGIATNPDTIQDITIFQWIYEQFSFISHSQFVVTLGMVTVVAFCIKSVAYIFTNSYVFKVTFDQKQKLVSRMMSAYLYAPYTYFLDKNTSSIIQKISIETTTFSQEYMMSLLIAAVNFITILFLLILLANTNLALLAAILGVILLILACFKLLSSRFRRWGRMRTEADQDMIRTVNHSLGGIKETRVIGCEPYFEKQVSFYGRRWAQSVTLFRSSRMVFPVVVQTSLLVIIILFICGSLLFNRQDLQAITSIMAIFAAASLRLIPAINHFINAVTSITNSSHIVDVLYRDLKDIEQLSSGVDSYTQSVSVNEKSTKTSVQDRTASLCFRRSIELQRVSYQYPQAADCAIRDVSIQISRGESVALIGKSGAGKTTLVDIILGLLQPQAGDILVDGVSVYSDLRAWQNLVGYIPQSIFLMDDTVERNIAFGVPDHLIDHQKLFKAIEAAQLTELIESLPDGISTPMGERGIRLSGGQRQRIGIARALYHEREVLILDEATAALDNETEQLITTAINSLTGDKTLIIIAHRLTTIEQCNRVYLMANGEVKESGTFAEVVVSG